MSMGMNEKFEAKKADTEVQEARGDRTWEDFLHSG